MLLAPLALAADATWTGPNGAMLRLPAVPSPGAGQEQLAILFWPPDGGFSPNVNVIRQAFAGSLADWWSISESQFRTMGVTVVSRKDTKVGSRPALRVEYAGFANGFDLHFDALAIADAGAVWLATCTAPNPTWSTWAPRCKQALDSFTVP
ncbi:MAG: hypothetical protein ACOZNI_35430 [Myxococcota bacterium]